MKEIRRSAYSQSACGGPANGHGSGLTLLIRLSTGRMANVLHVWSRSRFDLPGAFNCFSLSWLNGTRPFSVWPPHGVITFRTPFNIDALVGHDGGLRACSRNSYSRHVCDSGVTADRRMQVSPQLPGTLCRSGSSGSGLDQMHTPAFGWRRSVEDVSYASPAAGISQYQILCLLPP